MTARQNEHVLARAGALLILIALVTGIAIPTFTNPRQALSAHVSSIMTGLLLIALASLWSRLTLSVGQRTTALRLAIGGAYANLVGSLLAAAWGTNRRTPFAGVGFGAERWKETMTEIVQVSQGVVLIVALALVVYGLRRSESE